MQPTEIGHKAVDDRVSVHNLHASIIHLLEFDHERWTFRHNGRDFRLTNVDGRVVPENHHVSVESQAF